MQKSKFVNFVVMLTGIFLLNIRESYAFFSPTSLQLLASSIGPWFQYLLIIIVTVIISFSVNLKKKWKKPIQITLIICLIILIVFVAVRFVKLRELNRMDNQLNTVDNLVFIDDLEGLSALEVEEIRANKDLIFDKEFQRNRYVALDSLNESEYYSYKKIVLFWYMENEYLLKDAIYLEFDIFWQDMHSERRTMEAYLKDLGISKDDRLLIICYGGGQSQLIGYFLYKYGYNAYYGSMHKVNNENFIDNDMLKKINRERSIIVDSLDYKADEKYYLFLFNIVEDSFFNNLPSLMEGDKPKSNIYGIKAARFSDIDMKIYYPDMRIIDIEEVDLKNSKVICLTQLHCLLTKHKVDSLNLGIGKVYYAGDIDNW